LSHPQKFQNNAIENLIGAPGLMCKPGAPKTTEEILQRRIRPYLILMIAPALAVFGAFFILPMARLVVTASAGPAGFGIYLKALTTPRYVETLMYTIFLSAGVTLVTLVLSGISGVFLTRNDFPGKSVLVAMLTFPLAFPGVVVGFMIILLVGRQGLVGDVTQFISGEKVVLAYSMAGLFLGYLYFSIPRVITTIMAAAEKIDISLEEAARSLGASPWRVVKDVLIPALVPGIISSGAICFATSMGAFGTAFTLATDIDVLPIVIYTEFTLLANIAMASALSIVLGLITWLVLSLARTAAGATVAAAG
jgi:putative spermidine/putrescine transport system permease protein